MKKIISFYIFLFFVINSYAQEWKKYPYAPEHSRVSFPKDEGVHAEEPIEWWYTVGHLTGQTTGIHYSFMLTYFDYPQLGFSGFRIFNISNDDDQKFYGETLPINFTTLAKDSLNIVAKVYNRGVETWTNKLDANGKMIPFEYTIAAASATGSLNMEYVSLKPPLILADSGFFYQGATNYTYYYSQTENVIIGTITLNGISEKVAGTGWIDRQYGSFNPYSSEKYEWFSLQLSNGMDLNIFNIFTNDNRTPDTLTYKTLGVYVNTTTQYTTSQFDLERSAFRYTADSAACYSKKWRLISSKNNIDLTIEAPYPDYEVKIPFRFYEGPVTISGSVNGIPVSGKGFAELLHPYVKPIVELSQPSSDNSQPLTWKLKNYDEARPVKYDVLISIDNQLTYTKIAEGLTDTMFHWTDRPLGKYWLKLTAYSLDSTLINEERKEIDPTLTYLSNKANKFQYGFFDPANQVFHMDVNLENKKMEVQLTNMHGKTFQKIPVKDGKRMYINVQDLTDGFYFVQIIHDNKTIGFKFLKE